MPLQAMHLHDGGGAGAGAGAGRAVKHIEALALTTGVVGSVELSKSGCKAGREHRSSYITGEQMLQRGVFGISLSGEHLGSSYIS